MASASKPSRKVPTSCPASRTVRASQRATARQGCLPNTRYFGRAADVWWVNGKPVEGNAADPDVLKVGRLLARGEARPDNRAAHVVRALGCGREEAGFWHPISSGCTRITSTSATRTEREPATPDEPGRLIYDPWLPPPR